MAPQQKIPVAANVLGTIGTTSGVCRIWTNWRTKNTDGLPGLMMFLWAFCGVPFGAYDIIQKFNMPLQVQPQCFMALSLTCWVQILIYGSKIPAWKGIAIGLTVAGTFAGAEAGLILGMRPLYEKGNNATVISVGTIASVLLAAGLIPPYFELYKRRGRVVGINLLFLFMDWCGAFFSLMAIAVQNTFDVLGGVIYIVCASLEIGIFVSHAIYLLRTRKLRKQAKAEGKTFDEILAERVAAEGSSYPFAERELPGILTATWWSDHFNTLILRRTTTKSSDEEETCASSATAAAAAAAAAAATDSEKQSIGDRPASSTPADKEVNLSNVSDSDNVEASR